MMKTRYWEDLKDFLYDTTMVVLVIIGFIALITVGWKIVVAETKVVILDREIQLIKESDNLEEEDYSTINDLYQDRRKIEDDKNHFTKWYFSLNGFFQTIIYLIFLVAYLCVFLLITVSLVANLKSKSNEKRGSPD